MDLYKVGETIIFTRDVKNLLLKSYFEENMKGIIIKKGDVGDFTFLEIDFSEFEGSNKSLMTPTFYDGVGLPTLKWCETTHYPENGVAHIFIHVRDKVPFTPINKNKKESE